jgi:hypothetical protein
VVPTLGATPGGGLLFTAVGLPNRVIRDGASSLNAGFSRMTQKRVAQRWLQALFSHTNEAILLPKINLLQASITIRTLDKRV